MGPEGEGLRGSSRWDGEGGPARPKFFSPLQIRRDGGRAAFGAKKGCFQGTTWRRSETELALPLSCTGTRGCPTAFAWWLGKTWSFLKDVAGEQPILAGEQGKAPRWPAEIWCHLVPSERGQDNQAGTSLFAAEAKAHLAALKATPTDANLVDL